MGSGLHITFSCLRMQINIRIMLVKQSHVHTNTTLRREHLPKVAGGWIKLRNEELHSSYS